MPTQLQLLGEFQAQASREGNHVLTRCPTVPVPTFVMRQNVATDNFRLPFCVGNPVILRKVTNDGVVY